MADAGKLILMQRRPAGPSRIMAIQWDGQPASLRAIQDAFPDLAAKMLDLDGGGSILVVTPHTGARRAVTRDMWIVAECYGPHTNYAFWTPFAFADLFAPDERA